ncbi:MAG: ABC transporter permease, partial [Firmicutes bacterium]|nr:ABC transporter permease [Bacillota bacterium]
MFTISFGLVKGAFFGALVAIVGCAAGMRTKSTADGVGRAAT